MAKKRTIAEAAKRTPRRDQRRSTRRPKAKAMATRPRTVKALRSGSPASADGRDIRLLVADAVEEKVRYVLRELLESFLRVLAGEAYATQVVSKDMSGHRPSPLQVTSRGASLRSPSDDDMPASGFAESAASHTAAMGWGGDEVTADDARAANDSQAASASCESDMPAEGDTAQEDAMARALLQKIYMVSETARAKYTALFYLRSLGDRGAFGGITITLTSLPGENQRTKRERVWWLKNEGAVGSQSRSRLERVSLTPLGKRAWELYRAVVPADQASDVR